MFNEYLILLIDLELDILFDDRDTIEYYVNIDYIDFNKKILINRKFFKFKKMFFYY